MPVASRSRRLLAALVLALLGHALLLGEAASLWRAPALHLAATAWRVTQRSAPIDTPIAAATAAPSPPIHKTAAHAAPPAAKPPLKLAPAFAGRYHLRQNGLEGWAEFSWQPQGQGYALQLDRQLDGRDLPRLQSQGRLGATGLAPAQFVRRRTQRKSETTAFDADAGQITLPGQAAPIAQPFGVQDRLSWWLQLAALAAGQAGHLRAGLRLQLPVLGLRKDVVRWEFEVVGLETLPDGRAAWHLHRAAINDFEMAMEVWLAPALDYLPVRLLMGDPNVRGSELWLDGAETMR